MVSIYKTKFALNEVCAQFLNCIYWFNVEVDIRVCSIGCCEGMGSTPKAYKCQLSGMNKARFYINTLLTRNISDSEGDMNIKFLDQKQYGWDRE